MKRKKKTEDLKIDTHVLADRVTENLARLRAEGEELSQSALAARAGVSPSMVSKIEQGKTVPTLDMIERLADAMGVDPAEMFRKVKP